MLGSVPDAQAAAVDQAMVEVHAASPTLTVVLGGVAAGGGAPEVRDGEYVLERIDEAVSVVEDALAPSV